MAATLLYETETERRRHLTAIHNLAMDLGVSEEYLRKLYETELLSLKEHARLKDFITVLVIKKIKEIAMSKHGVTNAERD